VIDVFNTAVVHVIASQATPAALYQYYLLMMVPRCLPFLAATGTYPASPLPAEEGQEKELNYYSHFVYAILSLASQIIK
jgi:hypothetical protein